MAIQGDCRACKVNTNQPTTHPPKPPAPRGWLPKPLRPGHAIVQKLGLDEAKLDVGILSTEECKLARAGGFPLSLQYRLRSNRKQ
ncbi:hypothetical protein Q9233_002453 [Columba guinea]|nr:hypothetical protein Q9233_002453 [Columba guinea]